MPKGRTSVSGLPAGPVYLTVFANDSNPGWGEAIWDFKPESQPIIQVPIVASWQDAVHEPPERLKPLFDEIKTKGYTISDLLPKELHQDQTRNMLLFRGHPCLLDEIKLPSGLKVTVADLLAVEGYTRLQEIVKTRKEDPFGNE